MSTFVMKTKKNVLVYGLPGTGKTTASKLDGLPASRDTDALIPPDQKIGVPLPPDALAAMRAAIQSEGGLWFTNIPQIVTFIADKTDWPIAYYTLESGSDQITRIEERDGPDVSSQVDGGMWVDNSKAMGRALSRSLSPDRLIVRELAAGQYIADTLLSDLEKLGVLDSSKPLRAKQTESQPEGAMGDDESDA